MTEHFSGWSEVALTRQGLYSFLAAVMFPPDEVMADTLVGAAGILDDLDLDSFPFTGSWRMLCSEVEGLASADDRAREYVRLFASGVDGGLCPPNESFYVTRAKGGGMAELLARLDQDYREAGFRGSRSKEPADHVATEMEFMSLLCAREAAAWRSADPADLTAVLEVEDRFLRWHLATWVPPFAERVGRATGFLGFYGSAVRFAQAFVAHDVDLVRALLGRVVVAT